VITTVVFFAISLFNQKIPKVGQLTKKDLLEFYQGEEVKHNFKSPEKRIEQL
jgi:hypothetical protein